MERQIKTSNNKISNKNLFYLLIILIGCFGLFLRIKAYFSFHSFWLDEALLAVNIVNKDIFGLFAPLENYQSAPILFLIFTKILTLLFGVSENVFRLIPFWLL